MVEAGDRERAAIIMEAIVASVCVAFSYLLWVYGRVSCRSFRAFQSQSQSHPWQ